GDQDGATKFLTLAQTAAGAMQDQSEPITLTVRADGALFIGDEALPFAALKPRLEALSDSGYDKPVYVRADGKAAYGVVAQVMAALSTGGFTKINLITETGGPSSGASSAETTLKPTVQ
ncbi:MAG: biopolymer transporter ExbD, partial [Pseudomonadota bacterium]